MDHNDPEYLSTRLAEIETQLESARMQLRTTLEQTSALGFIAPDFQLTVQRALNRYPHTLPSTLKPTHAPVAFTADMAKLDTLARNLKPPSTVLMSAERFWLLYFGGGMALFLLLTGAALLDRTGLWRPILAHSLRALPGTSKTSLQHLVLCIIFGLVLGAIALFEEAR